MSRASRPRDKGGRITLLGEAKATRKPGTAADVRRLAHVRDLLCAQGWDADGALLALYAVSEPAPDLVEEAEGGRALLLGMRDLYGSG